MRSGIARFSMYGLGLLMGAASVGIVVLATGAQQVPEVDGGFVSTGLGLVTAGVLVLRARSRSK